MSSLRCLHRSGAISLMWASTKYLVMAVMDRLNTEAISLLNTHFNPGCFRLDSERARHYGQRCEEEGVPGRLQG